MKQRSVQTAEKIAEMPAGKNDSWQVYRVLNLDCPNCGAKLERALADLPEVREVNLTFTIRQLRVLSDVREGLREKLQQVADRMEEGIRILDKAEAEAMEAAARREGNTQQGSCCGNGCCGGAEESHGAGHDHDHGHSHGEGGSLTLGGVTISRDKLEIGLGALLFIAAEWLPVLPEGFRLPALLVAYLVLAHGILWTAFRNLLKGDVFDENFLMTVATLGAFAIQAREEAVGVILFYRIGEYFEEQAVARSRSQIMEAVDLRPEVVNLLEGDEVRVVPAATVEPGALLLVRAGERIPLDGQVVEGESRLDTAPITGESVPVRKAAGDQVLSGCVNLSGMLKIRVEKPLQESMVTKILDSVENAAAGKPRLDKFITRFARVYTPFVVGAAVLIAVVPSLVTGNWHYWIYTALTFLVISCPCALVLSVPLAFFSGIGAGSKLGILFKGGNIMELLKNVTTVVMDKTGTVTKGDFSLQRVEPAGEFDEERLLALCASAEQASNHPIAESIVRAAKERGLELESPASFRELAGEGLIAETRQGTVLCGNLKLMAHHDIPVPAEAQRSGGSQVLVAVDGVYAGSLQVSDTVKPEAREAVARMKKLGLKTVMLTGDTEATAAEVAASTGIDKVHARLMPQDKLSLMREMQSGGEKIIFVGDGMNDAPVLAGADVGAAMGSGADAAIEAADVVFMTSEVNAVPKAIAIATEATKVAWQNVIFALAVKALIMVAGILGYASMWAAVFADTGVSVLCVLNSVRILYRRF